MPRTGSSDFPTLGVPDHEPRLPIFPEGHGVLCKASFCSSMVITAEILSLGNAFPCSVQRKRPAICSGSVRKRGEVALSLFMCPLLAKNIQVLNVGGATAGRSRWWEGCGAQIRKASPSARASARLQFISLHCFLQGKMSPLGPAPQTSQGWDGNPLNSACVPRHLRLRKPEEQGSPH